MSKPDRPPAPANSARFGEIDFTKGVLVALMVVYHWANYFASDAVTLFYLLRFLTPSFIFISGAVISLVSAARHGLSNRDFRGRLAVRGLKLVALFVALNLAIEFLVPGGSRGARFGLPQFTEDLFHVFVSGNSNSASFKVLLPIGYLLLVVALVAPLFARAPRPVGLVLLAASVGLQIAEWSGRTISNLFLLDFGLLGVALYGVGLGRLNAAATRLAVIAGAWLLYTTLVLLVGPQYWVQLLGVPATLLLVYAVGRRADRGHWLVRWMEILGRYSLFAYIVQIAILQAMRVGLPRLVTPGLAMWIALPSAQVLMLAMVAGVEAARARLPVVDRLYRHVFA